VGAAAAAAVYLHGIPYIRLLLLLELLLVNEAEVCGHQNA
jgi:hypothetical protein